MENETRLSGETVKVLISKVECNDYGYGKTKSYIVFQYVGANHIANVDNQSCKNYKVGDSLRVLYNKDYDLYFVDGIDTTNEKWGMILSGIFICIIVLNLLFPTVFKLPG